MEQEGVDEEGGWFDGARFGVGSWAFWFVFDLCSLGFIKNGYVV